MQLLSPRHGGMLGTAGMGQWMAARSPEEEKAIVAPGESMRIFPKAAD